MASIVNNFVHWAQLIQRASSRYLDLSPTGYLILLVFVICIGYTLLARVQ